MLQWLVDAAITLIGLVVVYRALLDEVIQYETRTSGGGRRGTRRSAFAWGVLAVICLLPSIGVVSWLLGRGLGPLENPVWAGLCTAGVFAGLFAVGMMIRLLRLVSEETKAHRVDEGGA